ncbi:MAG: hypothetical protein FWD97_08825, partial [Defluviitaleaceae bacterium]|nr:hypothetical protein [Defluviitaleaceae bacterium]
MEKQTGLKNPSIAWVISIILMVAGLFAGTFISFNNMRSDAQATFDQEIMPTIGLAMEFAWNVQIIAGRYLTIESDVITEVTQNIQSTNDPSEIFTYYVELNRGVWAIYDRLATVDMVMANRNLHGRYHDDFMEQDLRLSQSAFNRTSAEFNETLSSGLGFLVRPVISYLPRFDIVTQNPSPTASGLSSIITRTHIEVEREHNQNLVGTWDWFGSAWYTFNEDGTGILYGNISDVDITWWTRHGVLYIDGKPGFLNTTERLYELVGDTLRLVSTENGAELTYTRSREVLAQPVTYTPTQTGTLNQDADLVGGAWHWENFDIPYWEFRADGTGLLAGFTDITWHSSDGIVTIYGVPGFLGAVEYAYRIEGDTL